MIQFDRMSRPDCCKVSHGHLFFDLQISKDSNQNLFRQNIPYIPSLHNCCIVFL
jgi:hypothetical protein